MAAGCAIRKGLVGVCEIFDRRVKRTSFTSEKLLRNAREIRFRLPGIKISWGMDRSFDRRVKVIVVTIDRFCFAITKAHLFTLGLLQSGTSCKNDSQDYLEMTYSPAWGTEHV